MTARRPVDPEGGEPSFGILGPLRVRLNGLEIPVPARRQRALLVLLALNVGKVVPAERLIDQLWDGAPPPQAGVTLRSYISHLRKALAEGSGTASVLATRGRGYVLDVPPESVDAVRLRLLTELGREDLSKGQPAAALRSFERAVGLWVGDPLAEVADYQTVQSVLAELHEIYLNAAEGRFEAMLATGHHLEAIPGLESFARDHPLREAPQLLLMLALYRAGRAPDALDVHRRLQRVLRSDLGIDPSPRANRLFEAILTQDPDLEAPVQDPAPQGAPTPSVEGPPRPARLVPRTQPRAVGARIVGRDRELAYLASRLELVEARQSGSLLLLAGEPGIGKTAILEALETRARERDVRVHTARSPAHPGAPAFWLWSQVIDSMAADLDDSELESAVRGAGRPAAHLSDVVARRTGDPLPLTGDDTHALRFRLYEAVAVFIDRATRGRPTVITLDDIHWADVSSLELLSYLTSSLAARPLLVVAAYRDQQADRSPALEATLAAVAREAVADELQIRGLDPEAVASLAGDLLDRADGIERREFISVLYERTAGNPFFVRQLARLISETGSRSADSISAPAPSGVKHVVASRLKSLSPAALELIDAAAVVGREFDVRIAAGAADTDVAAALDAYDEAARAGLVERLDEHGGHLRFAHALVHEVVVEQLSAGRAAVLHARVAAQLELLGHPPVEQLAEHYWAARDLAGASAVSAQLAAADASAAVFAHESAEVYLRRALHLVESAQVVDSDSEITVLLTLFRLVATVRVWGDADAHLLVGRAMRLASGSPVTDATVRLWWSVFFFLFDRGDEPACRHLARTLLSSLERADSALPATSAPHPNQAARAAIHIMNIFPELATDDRPAARRHLESAKEHAQAADPEDLAAYDENLHVMVLAVEARWAALTGDRETHGSCVDAAIGLADADGRPFARAFARCLGASSAPQVALPADVRHLAADALEVSTRFGYQWLVSLARVVLDWADAHTHGGAARAASNIESMLTYLAEHGRHGSDFLLRLLLSDLYVLDGRDREARAVLDVVRHNPGFYGGLVVDHVEGKLRQLS